MPSFYVSNKRALIFHDIYFIWVNYRTILQQTLLNICSESLMILSILNWLKKITQKNPLKNNTQAAEGKMEIKNLQ